MSRFFKCLINACHEPSRLILLANGLVARENEHQGGNFYIKVWTTFRS